VAARGAIDGANPQHGSTHNDGVQPESRESGAVTVAHA
jgi:hypothetical protein